MTGSREVAGLAFGHQATAGPTVDYSGVPGSAGHPAGAAGDRYLEAASPARIARRYRLKAAVFGAPARPGRTRPGDAAPLDGEDGSTGPLDPPSRVVTGTVLDVSPQVLVIGGADGQVRERLTLTSGAIAWRGGRTEPAALRAGDRVVAHRHGSSREAADLIWANIGRVTGTIICRERSVLYVDCGDGRAPRAVMFPRGKSARIQVRFPRLEPGYLLDVIGLHQNGYLEGLAPATYQPTYRVDHVPAAPLVSGHLPGTISGAAIWHEPSGEPEGLAGVAYPAVDPHPGQAGDWATPRGTAGCVSLPYLSVGSLLRVRNDCSGLSGILPVVRPAPTARLFCDRSVACGPSPRGRIADLTMASFVELGGELDHGSFNATVQVEV